MEHQSKIVNRRNFIKKTSVVTLGIGSMFSLSANTVSHRFSNQDDSNIIGPKEGFSPQIGTLVSMLNWMRSVILGPVRGMTIKDLDYLHDQNANSIGAMLLHLAATERFYQIHTFEGKQWGDWSTEDQKKWGVASGLGQRARQLIKGNSLDFYLSQLREIRKNTLKELAKRDDKWLMTVDNDWGWGPTNNYCKWFHVCEHESNHNGQIKWIRSRLPSRK
ncbi:DinB family protein [Aquimarina mytili]|uniref:DUF664 domain-containing protein n=1 Tax=Aquimarina mytili TaxID=874423 RepID=A0A936ZXY9_9FLAO|nr:DinB family protein [Aquimarina mytili]MBL0684351.1 DUF664 domain-containing protein [Aquimarina mytili]